MSGRFWAGKTEAAMNSAFLDDWNVTPSGHPNDGRFDVITCEMSMSDRWKARKRLPAGTHVPHPDLSIRRLKHAVFRPVPTAKVFMDGRPMGAVVRVEVTVIADATSVAI